MGRDGTGRGFPRVQTICWMERPLLEYNSVDACIDFVFIRMNSGIFYIQWHARGSSCQKEGPSLGFEPAFPSQPQHLLACCLFFFFVPSLHPSIIATAHFFFLYDTIGTRIPDRLGCRPEWGECCAVRGRLGQLGEPPQRARAGDRRVSGPSGERTDGQGRGPGRIRSLPGFFP